MIRNSVVALAVVLSVASTARAQTSTLMGSVSFPDVKLTRTAVLEVTLEDVAAPSGKNTIATSRIARPESPAMFSLSYDSARVVPAGHYAVRARIVDGGTTVFIEMKPARVLTQGHGSFFNMSLAKPEDVAAAPAQPVVSAPPPPPAAVAAPVAPPPTRQFKPVTPTPTPTPEPTPTPAPESKSAQTPKPPPTPESKPAQAPKPTPAPESKPAQTPKPTPAPEAKQTPPAPPKSVKVPPKSTTTPNIEKTTPPAKTATPPAKPAPTPPPARTTEKPATTPPAAKSTAPPAAPTSAPAVTTPPAKTTTSPAKTSSIAPPPAPIASLPATFTGTLPCPDCLGIRYELTLAADGTYAVKKTFEGPAEQVLLEAGAWDYSSDRAVLVLKSTHDAWSYFAVRPGDVLRAVDARGESLGRRAPADLKRSGVVNSSVATIANNARPSGPVTADLAGTAWTLSELENEPVRPATDERRAIVIAFDAASGKFSGASGCNVLEGTFTATWRTLAVTPASPLKICRIDQGTERALSRAIRNTRTYRITGTSMEWFDEKGARVARFDGVPVFARR